MRMPSRNVANDKAGFSYRVVQTLEEFDAVKGEWSRIWENSSGTIFQTFEWLRTWWKFFGEPRKQNRLLLILILDGTSVRGIAPLFVERISIFGILSLRQLSFIGHGVSDYLDVLAEHGHEEGVIRGVVDALTALRSEFDVAVLQDFSDSSFFPRRLRDACMGQSFTGDLFEITQCPRTLLQGTWEETLASFSGKHRKDIAYELRNVNRNFAVEFELTSSADDVANDMDQFIAMHQERWTHAGHQGVFEDSLQARFHKDVAITCFQRGWLFLAFLRLNGKRVAVNYGFHCRGRVMTYLNGMITEGETSKYSPGKILHLYSMQESVNRKCGVYDFMRGGERYKYALGAFDVPNWTLILYPGSRAFVGGKMKAHFLAQAVQRRLKKERTMFLHTVNRDGWFSRGMFNYLAEGMRRSTRDSIRKIKNPERNLP